MITAALPCPACLLRDRHRTSVYDVDRKRSINRMLSVVCNTWPPDTLLVNLEECFCGHPWLETAQEDYERWLNGETDAERVERRGYPTVQEWKTSNAI